MRKIELLVPASSLEVLKIAVVFGADAVYIGGEAFGLRAKAKNFSHEDMAEGIAFAHEHGVKVYVTVNILAHNGDLPGVREYLQELRELKPDALSGTDAFAMPSVIMDYCHKSLFCEIFHKWYVTFLMFTHSMNKLNDCSVRFLFRTNAQSRNFQPICL